MSGQEKPSSSKRPFGVVIPAFGHPKFLAEAIVSACEQVIDRPLRVVVVDDGCRYEETGDTVASLLPQYEGTLFYLRQKNTRLPGARNAGIRFLLNLEPTIEAIYLLDADNRLSPNSLDVFYKALGSDPKVGWAYPDISFFGLTRGEDGFDTRETAPVYSPLKHLVGNISEAGSMVRADVFRAGVMFDETMTSGFEDWEFWLSALEAGYVGVRAEDTGFLYRGRPESMLADSRRLADGIIQKMRLKHKVLFDPKNILQREHVEAPTFAFHISGENKVYLASDLLADWQECSTDELKAMFQTWACNPVEHYFPTHIVSLHKAAWQYLWQAPKYMRWLLWQLRENKADQFFITYVDAGRVVLQMLQEDHPEDTADILSVSSDLLWRQANGAQETDLKQQKAYLSLPTKEPFLCEKQQIRAVGQRVADFEALVATFTNVPASTKHATRRFAGPHSRTVREILIRDICSFTGREPFPACTDTQRTIVSLKASLLNKATALRKVKALLVRLKQQGHETLVLVENQGDIKHDLLYEYGGEWTDFADSVVPLVLPGSELEYSMYLGKRYQRELTALMPDNVAIILRPADQVICCGPTAIVEALGEARQHGATGYVMLASEFMSDEATTELGFAKMLAFEHAITQVAADDATFVNLLSSQGFPYSKFLRESQFLEAL